MEIVKKNIISIIFGVVALAAVGVAFTMVPSDRDALQAKLNSSKQTHRRSINRGSITRWTASRI